MSSGQATASSEGRPAPEAGKGSQTVTKEETDGASAPPTLRLKLKKDDKDRKKVKWTSETVDNEHLGKKKSKCCCVFVKKRPFGESDSDESDGDCEHCTGHTPSDPKISQ